MRRPAGAPGRHRYMACKDWLESKPDASFPPAAKGKPDDGKLPSHRRSTATQLEDIAGLVRRLGYGPGRLGGMVAEYDGAMVPADLSEAEAREAGEGEPL
jgi:hypothetical protein